MYQEGTDPLSLGCPEGSNFIYLGEHRIVCDPEGDGIYLVGGSNPAYTETNSEGGFEDRYVRRVWKFNMATKIWTQLRSDDSPDSLESHCLANLGRRMNEGPSSATCLLAFAGSPWYCYAAANSNKTYLYDAGKERWEELTTSGHPPAADEESADWVCQAMAKYGENIYVATGRLCEEWNETELHRLNLRTRVWDALSLHKPGAPECRDRHEIVVDDDEHKVYVFGGAIDSMQNHFELSVIPYFDIRSNCWRELHTQPDPEEDDKYPVGKSCFGCVKFGDYVYIVVGLLMPEDGFAAPADNLWRLHLPTGQWSLLPIFLPEMLWVHSVDVDRDGVMYVFGGIAKITYFSDYSTQLWRIRLVVPPLKRLAWDKVLDCTAGKLTTLSDQELMDKLHLTSEFVAKVKW